MLKARIRPHGGIHPDSHKQLTSHSPVITMQAPWRLVLPLKQHAGAPALPVVAVGDTVKADQLIAKGNGRFSMPIHAPLAGVISAVDHGNITIKVDTQNPRSSAGNIARANNTLSREEMIHLIEEAGIVGMGGAMFPTADKLRLSMSYLIDTLIINGSECEPYLTCDDPFDGGTGGTHYGRDPLSAANYPPTRSSSGLKRINRKPSRRWKPCVPQKKNMQRLSASRRFTRWVPKNS